MKKSEIIERIIKEVESVSCYIVRVYGVSCGVGYDMNATIRFKNGYLMMPAVHALHQSWACLGHLRPNNPHYQYTGSCDVYQSRVIEYWEKRNGFKELLTRLDKERLEYILFSVK